MATYYTEYQTEKEITPTITRMANIKVYTDRGKEIGMATVAHYEDKNKVADMLIRDYELNKVWNSKEFSFNN